MTLLVLGLAVAVVAGLTLARMVRRRHPSGPVEGPGREWINVEDLTSPAVTLVALLVAFTLVQTFNSFQRAEQHASTEAGLVDAEYQAAGLLDSAEATTLRGDLVCYSRAVAAQEWTAADHDQTLPVVDHWIHSLESDIATDADTDAEHLSMSGLVDLQGQLVVAHDERVAEVAPAIPRTVTRMIELAALLMVVLLIGFTWHLRRPVRLALVSSIVILLFLVVAGIRELDTPYSGIVSISPDRMHAIQTGMDVDRVPCSADGTPTAAPS